MPDTAQTPRRSPSTPASPSDTPTPGTALETTKGATKIADSVVTKVAGIAAREVSGVHALGGSSARAIGNVTQRVGLDTRSQGVSVEVGEREATVEVTIVIEYGESIPEVAQEVRQQIIRRVEGLCGLRVAEVNIAVVDLHFAGDDEEEDSDRS